MATETYQYAYVINPATTGGATTGTTSGFTPGPVGALYGTGQVVVTEKLATDDGIYTATPKEKMASIAIPASPGAIPSFNQWIFAGSWTTATGAVWPVFKDSSDTTGQTFMLLSNESLPQGTTVSSFNGTNQFVTCLMGAVQVRTPSGACLVSELSTGDEILTPDGVRTVKFVGSTTRHLPALRASGKMPICIEAGALGELGPSEPIHCTPSHAFLVNGSLVEAQALVNGTSIRQLDDWETFTITYYSIELDDHALIWANNLLTETYFANYRHNGFSREDWDNYSDYVSLCGTGTLMRELELPRIPFSRQLPAETRLLLQLNEAAAANPQAVPA